MPRKSGSGHGWPVPGGRLATALGVAPERGNPGAAGAGWWGALSLWLLSLCAGKEKVTRPGGRNQKPRPLRKLDSVSSQSPCCIEAVALRCNPPWARHGQAPRCGAMRCAYCALRKGHHAKASNCTEPTPLQEAERRRYAGGERQGCRESQSWATDGPSLAAPGVAPERGNPGAAGAGWWGALFLWLLSCWASNKKVTRPGAETKSLSHFENWIALAINLLAASRLSRRCGVIRRERDTVRQHATAQCAALIAPYGAVLQQLRATLLRPPRAPSPAARPASARARARARSAAP